MYGTAAIIGGGIGGLAAARALAESGWRVTVYEREAGLSGAGTALGMWPGALAALDAIGVGEQVRTRAVPQIAARFLRADGRPLGTLETARPVYLLSRPALLDVLCAAVPERALRFGTPVASVAELRADVDVVVAADGTFSRARTELFGPRYCARYAGVTAWRGWLEDRSTDALTEVWGRGAKFGVTPQEGGRTNWYAAAALPERSFHPGRERARLRELFGSWAGPVPSVLDAVDEAGILRHDIHVVPRLPGYVSGNVALIGDAAHAMTPDLGRGACEALVDAVELARCLDDAGTVTAGLREYEVRRRRATQRLVRAAAAASWLMRRRRALWVRDGLVRLGLRVPPPD